MRKLLLLLIILVILLSSAGCNQTLEQYEKLIVQIMALDKLEDGGYQVTMLAYKADGSQGMLSNGTEAGTMEHVTSKGKSVYEALKNVSMIAGLEPFYAHNNGIIFGEVLAREGIDQVLDSFSIYTEIRPSVHVFVCEGRAADIIKAPKEGKADTARQISLIAKSGEKNGKVINVTVKDIISLEARQYSDIYIPIIARRTVGEESKLIAEGTAVFRDGKLAGFFDEAETRGLMILLNRMENGVAVIEEEKIGKITCEFSYCKTSVSVEMESDVPKIDVEVDVRSEIFESDGERSFQYGTDALAAAEKSAEEYMRSCIMRAIAKGLKTYKSDVFGFGQRLYLKFPKQFPPGKADWREVLQGTDYTIQVNADMRETELAVKRR